MSRSNINLSFSQPNNIDQMASSAASKTRQTAARNNQKRNEEASRGAGISGHVNQTSNRPPTQVQNPVAQGSSTSRRSDHHLAIRGPAPIGNSQGGRTVPQNMLERASGVDMDGQPSSSTGSGHTPGHVGGTSLGDGHRQVDSSPNSNRPSTSRPSTENGIYR